MSRFIVIPARILADERLSSLTHLRVLMVLGLRADENGWCFPKRSEIAARAGNISRARVSQCIRDLRDWGYIEVQERSRDSDGAQTSNLYRVLFDIGAPVCEGGEAPGEIDTPPVSLAYRGVSEAYSPSKSHGTYPPSKSLAFTPVVNGPCNDPLSSSNAREVEPVDNSDADPLLLPDETDGEQPRGDGEPAPPAELAPDERAALELLQGLEQARGVPPGITATAKDRRRLRTWLDGGVTLAELGEAYGRAVAARARDRDTRPVNAGFLARFVEALQAESAESGEWWRSASGTLAQGERLGVHPRSDEPMPDFLVRVAKASGRGPWIDHVLREARRGNGQRYAQIVEFFGDALLPVDFYAS